MEIELTVISEQKATAVATAPAEPKEAAKEGKALYHEPAVVVFHYGPSLQESCPSSSLASCSSSSAVSNPSAAVSMSASSQQQQQQQQPVSQSASTTSASQQRSARRKRSQCARLKTIFLVSFTGIMISGTFDVWHLVIGCAFACLLVIVVALGLTAFKRVVALIAKIPLFAYLTVFFVLSDRYVRLMEIARWCPFVLLLHERHRRLPKLLTTSVIMSVILYGGIVSLAHEQI